MATDNYGFLISTHAPHAGSDYPLVTIFHYVIEFQPTLPMRGATNGEYAVIAYSKISTHAPHAGSDIFARTIASAIKDFNPRSPCGERLRGGSSSMSRVSFQPTLPMRGATVVRPVAVSTLDISTHAPHAGSDT